VLEKEEENLDIPAPEIKKEREKQIKVRYIGLITSVRKVQTKTGKLMGIATCEGVGINFTMVVFPKDYETFGPLLIEDQIAIVEGYFKGNPLS
jgi:DNA polymerase III alpha subunit